MAFSRVAHGNKILSFTISSKGEDNAELICFETEFDRKTQSILQQTNSVKRRKLPVTCNIIACKVVKESESEIFLPCLLLESDDNMPVYWYYFVVFTGKAFNIVGKFKSRDRISKQTDHVELLDGPLICYLYQNIFYFVHPLREKGLYKLASISFCSDSVEKQEINLVFSQVVSNLLLAMVTFVPQPLEFAMVTTSLSEKDDDDKQEQTKTFTLSFTNGFYTYELIDSTNFIPNLYLSLVSNLFFLTLPSITICTDICDIKQEKVTFGSKVLVLTTRKQLLLFENGKLLNCSGLPTTEKGSIYSWQTADGMQLAAVHTRNSSVHIIRLDNFDVVEDYVSIGATYQGDFLMSGTDQLMLINTVDAKEVGAPESWTEVIITNGYDQHITANLPQEPPRTVPSEISHNLCSAIDALAHRLQFGQEILQSLKREYSVKIHYIEETMKNLQKLVLDFENMQPSQQAGLVPLLTPDSALVVGEGLGTFQGSLSGRHQGSRDGTIIHRLESDPHQQSLDGTMQVTGRWLRQVQNKLVVGVQVTNRSPRTAQNLKLLTLMDAATPPNSLNSCMIDFISKNCQESNFTSLIAKLEPDTKRRKVETSCHWKSRFITDLNPGCTATIISVGNVPKFGVKQEVLISLLLHWTQGQEAIKNRQDVAKPGGKSARALDAGSIQVKVSDILCRNISINMDSTPQNAHEATFDLLALQACQDMTALTICSKNYPLSMAILLQQHLHFTFHTSWDMWVCLNPGPLCNICVDVRKETLHEVQCVVHTDNESQLFLLVHAIYGVASDDILIIPGSHGKREQNLDNLLSQMIKECSVADEILREMIKTGELMVDVSKSDKMSAESKQDKESDELANLRKVFTEKQKSLQRKSNKGVVQGDKFAAFRRVLNSLERKTDICLQNLMSTL